MRVGWNNTGYMDAIYDEPMREVEEECGILRSGVRFRQENRYMTEESPDATGTRRYKRISQGSKWP